MGNLKFKQPVNVQLLSRRTMRNSDDFIHMIQFHIDNLPELPIDKWLAWKDIHSWDEENLERIHKYFSYASEIANREKHIEYGPMSIEWKHTKKIKSEGQWNIGFLSNVLNVKKHSSDYFTYEFNHLSCNVPVRYLKQAAVPLAVDFAFIDTMTEEYRIRYQSKQDHYMYGLGGVDFFYAATFELIHCLPDMYWGVVFGKAYSELFGMDKLLSAPAYYVEQLSDDAVYIQLSETLGDVLTDFDGVQVVREKVKEHLGNAFFKPELAYSIRPGTPADEDPFYEPPEPGLVYNVPKFQLEKDRYVDWEDTWRGKEEQA